MDLSDLCSCDSYAYPYREERQRKARKEYRCCDCNGKILPGERHWYATGRCEGEWFAARRCDRCTALYEFVKAHIPCLCVSFGNMIEEIMEIADAASHEAPGLLFGAWRRKVLIDRYNKRQFAPHGEEGK